MIIKEFVFAVHKLNAIVRKMSSPLIDVPFNQSILRLLIKHLRVYFRPLQGHY